MRVRSPGRSPACWTPPHALVHLPPGEAVRTSSLEVHGAPAAHPPPTAPGFQRAWSLGLLPPPVPPVPPPVLPGLSSWDRLRLAIALCFGGLSLGLLIANGLDREVLGLVLAAASFGTGWWLLWSTDVRDAAEHAAGYTSGASYTGLWRLSRDLRVLRAPDTSVPPPGWYPSPYFPGVLQRWDGPGWAPLPQFWWKHESRYFRRPDVPFL